MDTCHIKLKEKQLCSLVSYYCFLKIGKEWHLKQVVLGWRSKTSQNLARLSPPGVWKTLSKEFIIHKLFKFVRAEHLFDFANLRKCHSIYLFQIKHLMILISLQSKKCLKEYIVRLSENACFTENGLINIFICVAKNESKYCVTLDSWTKIHNAIYRVCSWDQKVTYARF